MPVLLNPPFYSTLIRMHHIISRQKLSRVRHAALNQQLPFVLVLFGCHPGLMYAEGADPAALEHWVAEVKQLRYVGFSLLRKPGFMKDEMNSGVGSLEKKKRMETREEEPRLKKTVSSERKLGSWCRVTDMAEFGAILEERGWPGWYTEVLGGRGAVKGGMG